jgi:hypothetical protein
VDCQAVALLSPTLDYRGLRAGEALERYGARPVFIAASRGDTASAADSQNLDRAAKGPKALRLYEGSANGTALLGAQPALIAELVNWVRAQPAR